jgi:hypothetical protein
MLGNMFCRMAIRDATIIALGVVLWRGLAAYTEGDTMLADLLGLVLGLLVGTGGYFLHEWGHLAGAVLSGSVVHPPHTLKTGFLFSFDSKRNDKRQFLIMSLSGFAMTAWVTFAFYTFLPDGLLASRVARGVAMLGAFLAVFLETPILLYGLFGSTGIPPIEAPGHPRPELAPTEAKAA